MMRGACLDPKGFCAQPTASPERVEEPRSVKPLGSTPIYWEIQWGEEEARTLLLSS